MDYNEKCEKTDIGNSKNVEKIKQFMTSTDNQLPDISRECADIGSELRYFFNDDDLIIYRKANEESISSIFHEEAFYT